MLESLISEWVAKLAVNAGASLDAKTQAEVRALKADSERHSVELKTTPPNSPRMVDLVSSYAQMSDLASDISKLSRRTRARTVENEIRKSSTSSKIA